MRVDLLTLFGGVLQVHRNKGACVEEAGNLQKRTSELSASRDHEFGLDPFFNVLYRPHSSSLTSCGGGGGEEERQNMI